MALNERFEIDATHDGVRVRGEIDLATAPTFEAELRKALQSSTSVNVDFSEVSFIDSTGLHAILRCANELDGKGRIRLHHAPHHVVRIMRLIGFPDVAQIELAQGP